MQAFLGSDFDINEFPCSFNLPRTQKNRLTRLRTVEHTLTVELKNVKDCESEIIRKENLLSFIYFRLHKLEEAVQLSDHLVKRTRWKNVATLANRCFILWRNGDELEVRECRNRLKRLKNDNDFHVLLTEAKAEQAYYYLRLGGTENLRHAEMLFSQVVNEVPTNYLWKYGLALASRRATHGNIISCSSKPLDPDSLTRKAIQYFFEVADKGDNSLKSMAYAELVNLRQVHKFGKFPAYDALFRRLSVKNLIYKALKNQWFYLPSVLTQCGKALQWDNPDESIKLLERSVVIKPCSKTYHFLGKSYKRKAQEKLKISMEYPSLFTEGRGQLQSLPLYSDADIETDAVEQSIEGRREQGNMRLPSTRNERGWTRSSEPTGARRQLFKQPVANTQVRLPSNPKRAAQPVQPSFYLPPPVGSSALLPSSQRPGHFNESIQRGRQELFHYIENTYRDQNNLGNTSSCRSSRSSPSVNYGNRGQQRIRHNNVFRGHGQPAQQHYHNSDFNYGQYEQKHPHDQQQQNDFHDNKGMYNNSRGRSNFNRSFSSPTTAYETNRRFPRAGSNSRHRGHTDSHFERSLSEHEIIASSRQPSNQVYLNGDNEFVKKAVANFKKAIEVSNENLAAILDLGILLNETGNKIDALQQFNKVTNSKLASKSHRVSAISAFEQSGLCYLELGKAGPRDNENEKAGKRKLTQAVSLAAELALSMPELQGKTQDLWTAFKTLMNKIDEEQSSPTYIKDKVKLLELANSYRQIIDIFQNIPALTGNELSDKDIVTIAIESYHNLDKFEDALALQSIISLRPDVRESDWWKTGDLLDLRIKSLLHAAAGRLERATDTPTGLFQQVFQLLFGACLGAQDEDGHNPQAGGCVGDVLVVFNDKEEVNDDPDSSTVTSLGLQQVATSLFGLETERNLESKHADYWGCMYEKQLQEMRKYQVVMIVLGSETRCPKFNAVLENVFVNISKNEPTRQRRTLIIDAGLGDGQIPLGLTHYERFKLTNMSGLRCADPSLDNEGNGDELSYVDILTRGFRGNVNAVMELFCFMVGQKWPCS